MKNIDLLVTGVGGQGVVLASDIIGQTAIMAGYDVKKTDTLGMAQRGGAVVSHVRLAEKVYSPLIKEGGVDLILGFEKLESARWSHYLKPDGVAIINEYEQQPQSVTVGLEKYPTREEITARFESRRAKIFFVEGSAQAKTLGNVRTLNIFMLGCFSVFAPIPMEIWKESIAKHIPAHVRDINLTAFFKGS